MGSCALCSGALLAAEPGVAYEKPPRSGQVFRAAELSLDIFGGATVGEEVIEHPSREKVIDDGRLGLGVGANFFFTRYFGVMAEAYTENSNHSFVDDASGSLVVRFPIESARLAPYIFGGGGYQYDPIEQSFAHAGAGLEYRFWDHMGIFLDGRYVFTEDSHDFGLGRLGFRFSF